jgi:hypothetical protein
MAGAALSEVSLLTKQRCSSQAVGPASPLLAARCSLLLKIHASSSSIRILVYSTGVQTLAFMPENLAVTDTDQGQHAHSSCLGSPAMLCRALLAPSS